MDFLEMESLAVRRVILAICVRQGTPVHRDRPSHGFALRVSGEADYVFESGKSFHVGAQTLIYLPRGSSYTVCNNTAGETYAINFELSEEETLAPFAMDTSHLPLLKEFKSAEEAWRHGGRGGHARCMAALYTVLAVLQSERERVYMAKDNRARAEYAHRFFTEHCTDASLRVGAVAAELGISEVYLRRIFENRYGLTPQAHIRASRMKRACDLILGGDCSMLEAARQSGFEDYSYFSRAFKRETGLSPTQYAEWQKDAFDA